MVKGTAQHALCCPCGRPEILALGLCHSKVERSKMVLAEMTPLLVELWREHHPEGQEQVMLAFNARRPATQAVPLAFDDPQNETAKRGE